MISGGRVWTLVGAVYLVLVAGTLVAHLRGLAPELTTAVLRRLAAVAFALTTVWGTVAVGSWLLGRGSWVSATATAVYGIFAVALVLLTRLITPSHRQARRRRTTSTTAHR